MSTTTEWTARRTATLGFLEAHGAAETPHLFGDLLTHLRGVEDLVRAWGGSDLLGIAALAHATYGTDGFEPSILNVAEQRNELVAVAGRDVEALVYFYASCDRGAFYPQLEPPAPAGGAAGLSFRDRFTGDTFAPDPASVTLFVDLTYANEAELAASSPDGPTGWTWLAEFCRATRQWASPGFATGALALLAGDGGANP